MDIPVAGLDRSMAYKQFMIGTIVSFYVRDDLYDDGRIDSEKLRPIARLAGPTYAHLGEVIHAKAVHVSSSKR